MNRERTKCVTREGGTERKRTPGNPNSGKSYGGYVMNKRKEKARARESESESEVVSLLGLVEHIYLLQEQAVVEGDRGRLG